VTCGWQINTAYIASFNLDMRQRVAAVGRRAKTLGKGEDGMQHQLAVCQSYYHCGPCTKFVSLLYLIV
jgi:hypothetical protein